MSPLRSCQGPFAPRALPRFNATMGLSDSPAAKTRLMDSADASSGLPRSGGRGLPACPIPTFPARCPQPPRRSPPLLVNVASRRIIGFGIFDRLADLFMRNEAESGLLALRLTGSIHGASAPQLLTALSASLHARRSVGMMNTFHFIGLGWRCWRTKDAKTQRRKPSPEQEFNPAIPFFCVLSWLFNAGFPGHKVKTKNTKEHSLGRSTRASLFVRPLRLCGLCV